MSILVILIVIVAVIVFLKISKSEKEKEINKADLIETNQRLKEAAINGTDPRSVVGYRPIEKIEGLKNGELYFMVKKFCMELLKEGYEISKVSAWHEKDKYNCAWIHVNNSGCIIFRNNVTGYGESEISNSCKIDHSIYAGKWKHSIQRFPFMEIQSFTPYTEDPPEWLMICAKVMKEYGVSITEPEWVSEKPEARKYVNVMFR